MATPVPHIKSAARKLPIKRKSPPQTLIQSPDPISLASPINPNPNPSPIAAPTLEPYVDPAGAEDEYDDDYDGKYDDDYEDEENFAGGAGGDLTGGDDVKPPPFKFHRIWSEPDEIRFLQGLQGCWSQGMVFPRDLNLFYDRFSESMPQPYTRSQLSEKLRRLRKKFRIMSGRIARGQDPARLAPHDRDLLHLCTRLWDPAYGSSSPFSTPDSTVAPVGNKRRRPNPRPGRASQPVAAIAGAPSSSTPPPPQYQLPTPTTLSVPDPLALALTATSDPTLIAEEKVARPDIGNPVNDTHLGGIDEDKKPLSPPANSAADAGKGCTGHLLAKTVLDLFEGTLNELRATLSSDEVLRVDNSSNSGSNGRDFTGRWQEQRLMELDVLASRLRLVIEDSFRG